LGVYFNSILFAIMGLVINLAMFRDQWLAMLVAIGVAEVAGLGRFASRNRNCVGLVASHKFALLVDNSVNGLWGGAV